MASSMPTATAADPIASCHEHDARMRQPITGSPAVHGLLAGSPRRARRLAGARSRRSRAAACAAPRRRLDARDRRRGRRPRRRHEPGRRARLRPARLHLPGDPRPLLHGHGARPGAGASTIVRVLIGAQGAQRCRWNAMCAAWSPPRCPPSWPLAALEAQAVASRTYALTAHAGGSRFDVYSDTRSQVYRGAAAETPQTNAAVAATAGQIVTYAGKPAITYFFASSGGMTESVAERVPRRRRPSRGCAACPTPTTPARSRRWKLSHQLRRRRRAAERPRQGRVPRRRGARARLLAADRHRRVLGSAGTTRVSGPELAGRLGLDDTWAYFSVRSAPRHPLQARARTRPTAPAAASPASDLTTPAPRPGPGCAAATERRDRRRSRSAPAGGTRRGATRCPRRC